MNQSLPYQPITNLSDDVLACFSSKADGSIAVGGGAQPTQQNIANTEKFLERFGFKTPQVQLFVTYGEDRTYADVHRVDTSHRGNSIVTDALYTTEPGLTITLPVADCVATVVYDPVVPMLGVLHLGRHASVQRLIESFGEKVQSDLGTDPSNWRVWMSPSLQATENRLEYFEPPHPEEWQDFQYQDDQGLIHIDIPAHNKARFVALGVPESNIYVSDIDTYADTRYFSHRVATEQDDASRQGRMMVAVMMRS